MRFEKSIGAIVFKDNEYLLLKYGLGHWGFVKGNVEKGETKEETIFRELKEETGITNAEIITGFEEEIEYYYSLKGDKIHKKVIYFLMKSNTKSVKLSYEHDNFEWLPFEKALKKINFRNQINLLKKANKFLNEKSLEDSS